MTYSQSADAMLASAPNTTPAPMKTRSHTTARGRRWIARTISSVAVFAWSIEIPVPLLGGTAWFIVAASLLAMRYSLTRPISGSTAEKRYPITIAHSMRRTLAGVAS